MKHRMLIAGRLGIILATTVAAAACRTAQGAREDARSAANAVENAAEAVFTDQGAESLVQGSIAEVDRRARAVLADMGMELTKASYEDNATEREYEARSGDRVGHVKLVSRGAGATHVNVSYRVGRVDYDREQARTIILRIHRRR